MARTYTLKRSPAAAPASVRIDYGAELNPQQAAAATASPGPLLVIAGAGSGKTRTLIYRVAYLLENGVLPANVLLLTFTNKAAREMLDRVSHLLSAESTDGLWGGTFHSVGNRLLRRHAEVLGFRRGFSIMDREDQQDLLKTVVGASGVNPKDKRFPKAEVLAEIFSLAVNTGAKIPDLVSDRYPYFLELTEQIERVHRLYEAKKVAVNSLDFDDLLEKSLRLLRERPDVAELYQRQFQFVLVDEYQDTNQIQADFVDLLAARHQNIMVVGDDAQSIYSWRGANFENILQFPRRYPRAQVLKIETNYRSTPEILAVANAAIAANVRQFPKELRAARGSRAAKPAVLELSDSNQQALFVTQRILELRDEGVELNEIAVLYRAHFHSMELQLELTRHGVPFQITSGLRFFEQAHVKDVASFLKFTDNPRDEVAFKRIVRLLPGVGNVAADKLWRHFEAKLAGAGAGGGAGGGGSADDAAPETAPADVAAGSAAGAPPPAGPALLDSFADAFADAKVGAKTDQAWRQFVRTLEEIAPHGRPVPPAVAIEAVVEAVYDDYAKTKFPNYEARREDLNVLVNYARQYQETSEFLSQLALVTSLESPELTARRRAEETESVTLSSVHQAKGLEWKVVFVIHLTEGSFPGHRSLESAAAVEEERRLFYVAVTRACDELYLVYPSMRLNAAYGDMFQRPSRFVQEIPLDATERWEVERGF